MPKHTNFFLKAMPLAGFLASSMILCTAQTSTTPPASKPAAKKPATAAPAKTAAGKTAATKTAATKTAAPALALTTPKDKTSYAIGADLGNKLKASSIDVDPAILTRGIKDVLAGSKTAMTDEEVHSTLVELSKQLQQKQAAVAKEAGEKNRKEGDAFLAENKGKEGVVALPSGLQYKILKAGDGPKPRSRCSPVATASQRDS